MQLIKTELTAASWGYSALSAYEVGSTARRAMLLCWRHDVPVPIWPHMTSSPRPTFQSPQSVSERILCNLTHCSERQSGTAQRTVCGRGAWRAHSLVAQQQVELAVAWIMTGCAVTSVSECHSGHYDTCHYGHYGTCHCGHCMTHVIMVIMTHVIVVIVWHISLWSLYDTCDYGHYMMHVTLVTMTYVTVVIVWHMSLWSFYDTVTMVIVWCTSL